MMPHEFTRLLSLSGLALVLALGSAQAQRAPDL